MLSFTYSQLSEEGTYTSDGADKRLVKSYPALLRQILDDHLTKTQKCYIMLYYRDGLTEAEIAERFGVNKSTVSRTIHRGRERLKRAINCELLKKTLKDKVSDEGEEP